MGKRYLSALLALVLTLAALPARAWAAPPDPAEETAAIDPGLDTSESEELFAGYVERTLYENPNRREAMLARYGESMLTGANLQLYNLMRAEITKVANGTLGSSIFKFNTTGMGIRDIGGKLQGVSTNLLLDTLLADLPYEMYWFDKTEGWKCSWSYNTGTRVVSSIEFKLNVAQNYAVDSADGKKYYIYKPDTAKTGAAAATARNAQAVVNSYGSLSDYDKLRAYRDYISEQVKYNSYAADHDDYPYGDPWQLIYVFDNNPNTNVVCEGYAKAFKYLCDLSSFSNRVECYTVSGYTSGPHMWNIVRINGQSYLADVTNADTDKDNVKPLDALFLVGAPNGTANGYTITVPRYETGGGRYVPEHNISYTYKNETKGLYSADILTLAQSNYVPSAAGPATPTSPNFTDLVPNAFYQDAVKWAVANGITAGTTPTSFSPKKTCTQAEILTFLWRAAGEPESNVSQPDLLEEKYYYKAVVWATELGMIGTDLHTGASYTNLNVNAPCTRLDAVYYIWCAFGKLPSEGRNPFTDVPMSWPGAEAVMWATDNGVTQGTSDTAFSPYKVCNRGEIVTFLHRAYE